MKIARKALRSHSSAGQPRREGLVIDVRGRASDCTADTRTTMSPLTDASPLSTATAFPQQPQFASPQEELLPVIKRNKLAKHASEERLEAKLRSELYNQLFKIAFKQGTNLHSAKRITSKDTATSSFSVDKIVADLNQKYNLIEGNKKLSKTMLYRAVRHGKVGKSPMKRGPAPKVPDILLDVISLHARVSQVGKGGELRGREIKQILGAAVLGTKYEDRFTVESAWKKLRTQHPEQLQAWTKVSMEEARSKWSTINNLEQWFDDMKADLINSGLVIDREVRDEEGAFDVGS